MSFKESGEISYLSVVGLKAEAWDQTPEPAAAALRSAAAPHPSAAALAATAAA